MSKDYVVDLYIIGLILVFAPPLLGLLGLVTNMNLDHWVYLFVCGFLITSYISLKYNHELRREDTKISIPAWIVILIIIAIIVLYIWWRFS